MAATLADVQRGEPAHVAVGRHGAVEPNRPAIAFAANRQLVPLVGSAIGRGVGRSSDADDATRAILRLCLLSGQVGIVHQLHLHARLGQMAVRIRPHVNPAVGSGRKIELQLQCEVAVLGR